MADIIGTKASDTLTGQGGADSLSGLKGNDILDGRGGNDIIDGGRGDDIIRTGTGHDTVVFTGKVGNDIITDFDPTHDKIDLTSLKHVDSLDDLNFSQDGDSVVITGKIGGSITVEGVTVDELQSPGVIDIACFLRGTLIRTPLGEVPVEALAIGDRVTTIGGEARPIRWIGRRAFSARFATKSPRVVPVLVQANAIAEGVPHRDLRVSPEHALYIDGVLVPAGELVNGRTIVREMSGSVIEYFHIEFETQDILFADGTPAETYVNHDNRKMFANWEEYVDLYGDDASAKDENGDPERVFECITAGPRLEAIRERLNHRAPDIELQRVA
jgi:Hint domain/RTX calcium-binding nonapeptide repeat (4 copies)